jgi:hypothetical protein
MLVFTHGYESELIILLKFCDQQSKMALKQTCRIAKQCIDHTIEQKRHFYGELDIILPKKSLHMTPCKKCGQWIMHESTSNTICKPVHLPQFEEKLASQARYRLLTKAFNCNPSVIFTFRLRNFKLRCMISTPTSLFRIRITDFFFTDSDFDQN